MKFKEFLWFLIGRLDFFQIVSHQKARARWAEIVSGEKDVHSVWLRTDKEWVRFNKSTKSEEYK